MNKSIQDLFNDAVRLVDQDQFEDAIKSLQPIINLKALLASAIVQRGRCHWEMHRWKEAKEDFDTGLQMDPDSADAKWTVGLISLQMGDFERGWKFYESRWDSDAFKSPKLKTKLPRWEDGKGYKSVLVWCEQGIGDQVIYGSLLSALRERVEKVTVIVDIRLMELFKRGVPGVEFVRHDSRIKNKEFDCQIPIGSLGAAFIRSSDDIPLHVSNRYLKADPLLVQRMKNELGIKPDDFVIGLSWASTAPRVGEHKSVPLKELLPLFKLPNAKVVNLQYGKPKEEIAAFEKETGMQIHQTITNTFFDLEGVAAMIDVCNVVVSCSNANVHIAGAMGVPTYVLDANKLWYWNHKDENRSLFYPSVKLFTRENMVAPWTKPIQELVEEVGLYLQILLEFKS